MAVDLEANPGFLHAAEDMFDPEADPGELPVEAFLGPGEDAMVTPPLDGHNDLVIKRSVLGAVIPQIHIVGRGRRQLLGSPFPLQDGIIRGAARGAAADHQDVARRVDRDPGVDRVAFPLAGGISALDALRWSVLPRSQGTPAAAPPT